MIGEDNGRTSDFRMPEMPTPMGSANRNSSSMPKMQNFLTEERKRAMNRFEFFHKILTQIEQIQTGLNALRETIKKEISNEECSQ